MNTMISEPLTISEIRHLVPGRLPRRMDERCSGVAVHGSLAKDFNPEETDTIVAIYQELGLLLELTRPDENGQHGPDELHANLVRFVHATQLLELGSVLETFESLAVQTHDTRLATLFSEVVGGPFASLYSILFLVKRAGIEPEYFRSLFYLARDHRKIMRSLITDLDTETRKEDETEKYHSIELLLQKWKDAIYRAMHGELNVNFQTSYDGYVAERCIEFAEVDRLFYLIANYALKSAKPKVLSIQAEPSSDKCDLIWLFRWVPESGEKARMDNLKEQKRSIFEQITGADRKDYGLQPISECVAHAYGLDNPAQSISGGYVGSVFSGKELRIWFHWPIANFR